jgi:hypothetical protein
MKKTIRLPLLNLITLDKATGDILDRQAPGKKLGFVRQSILNFASKQGFAFPHIRPDYAPAQKWQKVNEAKNKRRSVDYSYVIAYYWLKSLAIYSYRQKSDIIREAIKSFNSSQSS